VPEAARKIERSGEKLSMKNRGPIAESSLKASDLIGHRPVRTSQQGGSDRNTWDNCKEKAMSRIPHSSLSEFKALKSPLGIAAILLLFSVLEQW
jgi:hypothetical protein